MSFVFRITALAILACSYYYIYIYWIELIEYGENTTRIWREVTRRELNEREEIKEEEYQRFGPVPLSGWNFASTPTDRENTIENCQNSQLCSIQASHGRKKINENS